MVLFLYVDVIVVCNQIVSEVVGALTSVETLLGNVPVPYQEHDTHALGSGYMSTVDDVPVEMSGTTIYYTRLLESSRRVPVRGIVYSSVLYVDVDVVFWTISKVHTRIKMISIEIARSQLISIESGP